jgi:hypothetical protein
MHTETGWKCENCDHVNTSESLICEQCGQNYEIPFSINPIGVCPVCGQHDAIQRLSAVFLGGKFYLPQMDGTSLGTSELARLMAPPPSPNPSAGVGTTTWVGLLLFFGFWPFALVTSNYLYFNFFQEYAEGLFPLNEYFETLLRLGIPASVVFFIFVILVLFLTHFIMKYKTGKRYEIEKPIWEQAMMHWNLTYYCHRDGVVFASETDKIFAAQDIYGFLYSDW